MNMKSFKSKDVAKLVRIRNNMLEAWAKENSDVSDQGIAKWISEVDRLRLSSSTSAQSVGSL
jgi:hypothetical protein